MRYETKGAFKFADRDIFSEGRVSEGSRATFVDYPLQADNLEQILISIAGFVGCENSDIEVNACDEPGRIDATIMETAGGFPATPSQIERWKTGDCDLWYCIYSFQFDEVTRIRAIFGT